MLPRLLGASEAPPAGLGVDIGQEVERFEPDRAALEVRRAPPRAGGDSRSGLLEGRDETGEAGLQHLQKILAPRREGLTGARFLADILPHRLR